MNILMTGSSGYVGKSFIKEYGDIYDIKTFSLQDRLLEELDLSNVDTVIHLAALVHQMNGASKEEYERINVKYTVDLAQKTKKSGVKQFIFMSSLAVYGDSESILREDSECVPVSKYGKSKLSAEKKLLNLASDNFIVSIIRPPMIYGYEAPGNIKSLINIIKKLPILPFGGIDNKRSFVYIDNLTSMVDKVIQLKIGGIFLATDDEPISTTRLMGLLAKALDKKLFLIKIPFFSNLLKKIKPKIYSRLYDNLEIDNSYTKKVLDFKTPYSIEEGINMTVTKE